MPECSPSPWLESMRSPLEAIVAVLSRHFDYISVLGTDDSGFSCRAVPGETSASEPMWIQRGFVARAQSKGLVVEYSFNEELGDVAETSRRIGERLDALISAQAGGKLYPPLPDEVAEQRFIGRVAIDALSADPEPCLARLAAIRDKLLGAPGVVSAMARADFVRVSRCFISPGRDLFQCFDWSQAYLFGVARRAGLAKSSYRVASGLLGLEVLDLLEPELPGLATEMSDLLEAGHVEPGEYDVILCPDMAGTLAHEAFGHGVELDMFAKKRAKAAEYFGKRVASPIVNMYDGASGTSHVGSFLFDDEGNFGTKTEVIKDGILVGAFSDGLSALELGFPLTGNGRRQAYDHKAYARMTNTYFASGAASLDDMIASTRHGWLLDRLDSGMEDPRNWGIQLVALIGKEIKDGALTGRIASPVFCSGYVPDVLGAISMISSDFELSGSGACGKGYKEFVKVSSGGPCVKTRMNLG